MPSLSHVFKAYDIRGLVPEELNALQFRAIGVAVARFTGAPTILVARDMRESGVALSESFGLGARSEGATVVDLGLASTDLLYFAAGKLDAPGAMFTASHNPAQYNGLKLCKSGARPIGRDTGLAEIQATAEALLDQWATSTPSTPKPTRPSTTPTRATSTRSAPNSSHSKAPSPTATPAASPARSSPPRPNAQRDSRGWEYPAFWALALVAQALIGPGAYVVRLPRRAAVTV